MIITNLYLVDFRNYQKAEFALLRSDRASEGLSNKIVLVGDNGVGKTNILEAIYMLATGKSFRADSDHELVRYGQQFTILNLKFEINNQFENLQISIGERKRFEVNGVPRRMVDFAGKLKAVLFGPADLEIITGSPSKRRKYLDFVLSQKDREYRRSLLSYEKGLRQRNRLLDLIRDGKANRTQLFFWDKLLIKEGNYLTEKREEYIQQFEIYNLKFEVKSQAQNFKIQYDKSVISEARLKMYENEEVFAGNTLVGPHRDDFVVLQSNNQTMSNATDQHDISKFGSRGQQRMAILALKIFELNQLTSEQLPVLLLDDVFSELDHGHRDEVLKIADKHAESGGQVIMTTADLHFVPRDWYMITIHD